MSQQKKLEQILELLVNEESERAEDLLHELVVEKARNIYEELVNDDDDEDEMEDELDEAIGGDPKENFVDDVKADEDDIESDELNDGEAEDVDDDNPFGDNDDDEDADMDDYGEEDMDDEDAFPGDDEMDFGGDMDGAVEGRVDDLESQLDDLRMAFTKLMADEMEEPNHDEEDMDDIMGGLEGDIEDDFADDEDLMAGMYEDLDEATKLQDPVADPGMKQEGKLAGTGSHSKTGATGTQSPYTNAPTKSLTGADPVNWGKNGSVKGYTGPAGGDTTSASDNTPSSNIDVVHKQEDSANLTGAGTGQNSEGKFSGTGKNSKIGATQTKSPLSNAPKKV